MFLGESPIYIANQFFNFLTSVDKKEYVFNFHLDTSDDYCCKQHETSSNVEKIFNLSMKYIWFNITVYETALSFIALPIPGGRGHWVCQLKDYAVEKLAF